MAAAMKVTASREDWLKARLALLEQEKALTKVRDDVAAARRALPKVKIEKDYKFGSPEGPRSLADLFAGKSQLIVYHLMLGPEWNDPCKSCSFWAEHFDSLRVHLPQRDVELAAVSRAPLSKIAELRQRFAWRFPWYSSLDSDFNFDFGVSFTGEQEGQALYNFGTINASKGELPGASVFEKIDDAVFHTYSTYARGLDALNGTYQWLDLTPKGRDEDSLPFTMSWVKLKDRY